MAVIDLLKATRHLRPSQTTPHIKALKLAPLLQFQYSPNPAWSLPAEMILSHRYHPLYEATLSKWAERKPGLWVSVQVSKADAKQSVVRTVMRRRLRYAWRTALQRRGYAVDGTPSGPGRQPLVGSVKLSAQTKGLHASAAELLTQTDACVEWLVARHGGTDARGRTVSRSSTRGQSGPARPPEPRRREG